MPATKSWVKERHLFMMIIETTEKTIAKLAKKFHQEKNKKTHKRSCYEGKSSGRKSEK